MKLIPLTMGQSTMVDDEDYEWLMQWKWFAHWSEDTKSFYARRSLSRKDEPGAERYMHRAISGKKNGFSVRVDHSNRDTLDNRRLNLRPASPSNNQMNKNIQRNNSSGFKGVSWFPRDSKWRARISAEGKYKTLGYFNDKESAARCYDEAAVHYYGEFALTNEMLGRYTQQVWESR